MINDNEILTKLGMAIYLHNQMIKKAEKAKDAVEYLASKGVFKGKQVKVAKKHVVL